jgi:hypothetical protein
MEFPTFELAKAWITILPIARSVITEWTAQSTLASSPKAAPLPPDQRMPQTKNAGT